MLNFAKVGGGRLPPLPPPPGSCVPVERRFKFEITNAPIYVATEDHENNVVSMQYYAKELERWPTTANQVESPQNHVSLTSPNSPVISHSQGSRMRRTTDADWTVMAAGAQRSYCTLRLPACPYGHTSLGLNMITVTWTRVSNTRHYYGRNSWYLNKDTINNPYRTLR